MKYFLHIIMLLFNCMTYADDATTSDNQNPDKKPTTEAESAKKAAESTEAKVATQLVAKSHKALQQNEEKKPGEDMFKDGDAINVAYLSDGYGSNLLTASMLSILDSSDKKDKFNFYILCGNVDGGTKESLKKLIPNASDKYRIKFIDINLSKYMDSTNNFTPSPSYLKIILPDLIPGVKKAIFIDTATMIRGSLKRVWDVKLGDNYAAVVEDINAHIEAAKGSGGESDTSGKYDNVKKFFTTHFIMLNLEQIKKDKISEAYRKEFSSGTHHLPDDVGVVNTIFNGHVTYLPLDTNISYQGLVEPMETYKKYDIKPAKEIEKAKKNPLTVRFENNSFNNPKHPYIAAFLKYFESVSSYNKVPVNVAVINIALIYDLKPAQNIANLMASILDSSGSGDLVQFHIISKKPLNKKTKDKFSQLSKIKPHTIKYITISDEIMGKIKDAGKKKEDAAIVAQISDILTDTNRVLFICSNAIVLESLSEFYRLDISTRYAAFAVDPTSKESDFNARRFNPGVILLNTKKIRDDKASEKVLRELRANSLETALRKGFLGGFTYVHPKWNFTTDFLNITMKDVPEGVTETDISSLKMYPFVVHFTGDSYSDKKHPFYNRVKYYSEHVDWSSKDILSKWSRYKSDDGSKYEYKPTTLKIAYIVNQDTEALAAASIKSILINKAPTDSFKFIILADQVSDTSKRRFLTLGKNLDIQFIDYDSSKVTKNDKDSKNITSLIKANCFVKLLNTLKTGKILYLDPATIVRGSLQKMYNTNIADRIALVIQHQSEADADSARNAYGSKIPNYSNYFNDGVMLIDIARAQLEDVPSKVLYEANNGKQPIFRNVLNTILARDIEFMPPQWNASRFIFQDNWRNRLSRDAERDIKTTKTDPIVLNFQNGTFSPANENAHQFAFEFLHYLSLTPWVDMLPLYNRKPKPVIQIKEIEVPKIVVEHSSFGSGLKKWLLGLLKKIPSVKKADPDQLAVPEGR